jgi:uncharacterized protein with HEPN domain
MTRSVHDRLRDIIISAELAKHHAGDLGADSLAATAGPRDATLYRIAVIGEAVSQLPADVQALAPQIPWSLVRSMRNHIVHGYWQVDFVAVADTVAVDLDPLKAAAEQLIALLERSDQ